MSERRWAPLYLRTVVSDMSVSAMAGVGGIRGLERGISRKAGRESASKVAMTKRVEVDDTLYSEQLLQRTFLGPKMFVWLLQSHFV